MTLAHLNAWLGRVKKFPKLDELLKRPAEAKPKRSKPKDWRKSLRAWQRFASN